MTTQTDPAAEAAIIDIEIVPADSGLEPAAKTSLELAFTGFFAEARKWQAKAESITDPKEARATRLELKSLRVAAEKKRKELKEDSLRMGKAIDGANNILVALIAPIEKHLDDIEKAEARAEAARIEKLREARQAELDALEHNSHGINLAILTDEQWDAYLQNAKDAKEMRIAREKREQEEAEAAAKAEAEERERQRKEAEAARLAAEAKAAEERKAREAAEAAAKAERAAREKAEAKAAKERAAAEAKAKAEREEAARKQAAAEAEAKRLREAEDNRIAAAAKERAAAEAARKKAAAAPDRTKICNFAEDLRELGAPIVRSDEARALAEDIGQRVEALAKWIEAKAAEL